GPGGVELETERGGLVADPRDDRALGVVEQRVAPRVVDPPLERIQEAAALLVPALALRQEELRSGLGGGRRGPLRDGSLRRLCVRDREDDDRSGDQHGQGEDEVDAGHLRRSYPRTR